MSPLLQPSREAKLQISFENFHNIVDGEFRSSEFIHSGFNPTTSKRLWDVPVATQEDVDTAVSVANIAFGSWKKTTWEYRSQLLKEYAAHVKGLSAELADLLILETGKPRFLAEGEISIAVDTILHFAELHKPSETVLDEATSKVVQTTHEPIGVVAAICPWNFPCALPMNKLGPALQAGNCIILKPSPHAPYSLLKLVEIAQNHFPKGVVQCLGGGLEETVGPWLTEHNGVHKVSFTGSCAVGKKVMAACAKTVKRVTLELGGNDASIICPDVDIESVAKEVALGVFINTGQVCASTKRLFVHQDIYPEMMKALHHAVGNLKVGGDEPSVMIGPLQNAMQFERVKTFVHEAEKCGYKFAVGSGEIEPTNGLFIKPMIIDNPPNDSRLITEEQFVSMLNQLSTSY